MILSVFFLACDNDFNYSINIVCLSVQKEHTFSLLFFNINVETVFAEEIHA